MDESQGQRRCSGLQNHSLEEISQEQNCCSSQAERGWESDSLQMGTGTFLLKEPENHWGGTNPFRTTADMSQENGLSLGSEPYITKHFIRKWTVFRGLILSRKWCDTSLYARCLHLALTVSGRKRFSAKKDLRAALFACSNI